MHPEHLLPVWLCSLVPNRSFTAAFSNGTCVCENNLPRPATVCNIACPSSDVNLLCNGLSGFMSCPDFTQGVICSTDSVMFHANVDYCCPTASIVVPTKGANAGKSICCDHSIDRDGCCPPGSIFNSQTSRCCPAGGTCCDLKTESLTFSTVNGVATASCCKSDYLSFDFKKCCTTPHCCDPGSSWVKVVGLSNAFECCATPNKDLAACCQNGVDSNGACCPATGCPAKTVCTGADPSLYNVLTNAAFVSKNNVLNQCEATRSVEGSLLLAMQSNGVGCLYNGTSQLFCSTANPRFAQPYVFQVDLVNSVIQITGNVIVEGQGLTAWTTSVNPSSQICF
jgi:hypothetical protein